MAVTVETDGLGGEEFEVEEEDAAEESSEETSSSSLSSLTVPILGVDGTGVNDAASPTIAAADPSGAGGGELGGEPISCCGGAGTAAAPVELSPSRKSVEPLTVRDGGVAAAAAAAASSPLGVAAVPALGLYGTFMVFWFW